MICFEGAGHREPRRSNSENLSERIAVAFAAQGARPQLHLCEEQPRRYENENVDFRSHGLARALVPKLAFKKLIDWQAYQLRLRS